MLLSTFVSPVYAAGGSLVPSGFGALVSGLTYSGSLATIASAGVGALFGSAINWASGGISIDASDFNDSFNKNYNTTINNTGATNNYRYNSTKTTNTYQVINTTNKTYYNPITNNYNTFNNISYNKTYNTYNISNDTYNTYVTNNYNYVSYYVIDINTDTPYYYEIYYQLPDGRNSFDLKPEDIWGTYFIYNATNYREVAEDDGTTLALWHLDGNTKNEASSNYTGSLTGVPQNWVQTPFGSGVQLLNSSAQDISFSMQGVNTIEFRIKSNVRNAQFTGFPFYHAEVYYSDSGDDYGDKYHSVFSDSRIKARKIPENAVIDAKPYYGYWTTVALVRGGDFSGVWNLYLNGKFVDVIKDSSGYSSSGMPAENGRYYGMSFNSDYFHLSNWTRGTKQRDLGYVVYDEIRLSNKRLYSSNYTPRTQPFDTNKVLVVPDPATMTDTTIAVKSSVPVGALRVGGVRPTFPSNGDVYVVEEKGIVKDVQQFQQDGWYSVQASLYIDGEWKLFVGFDISGFGLNKPDSSGGGTGPGGSGDSGGGSGGDSGGGGSGFWDKLLQSTFGGILSVLASLLSGLLTLLGAILTMLLGIVGYIGIFLPFLPGSVVTLIGGGVFIVLALVVIKFIGGLL